MSDSDILNASVSELHRRLLARAISSEELTNLYLGQIEAENEALNAVITLCREQALTDAREADQTLSRGEGNPLTGIPVLHKDIFCTQGVRTTCGSHMLETFERL